LEDFETRPIMLSDYRNPKLPASADVARMESAPRSLQAAKPRTYVPPTLGLNFEALSDVDPSVVLPLGSNRGIPPDTQGAVGPKHIMSVTNLGVRIHDRKGNTIGTVSLRGFWGLRYVSDAFDPYILYDSTSKRFIFLCDAQGENVTSSILIGV